MGLSERFERLAQAQSSLKSYYKDEQTANLCEAWRSCAKFTFEQYVSNQQFRVVKALLKNVTIRNRHSVHKEKRLYIQVTYGDKTENIVFFTPYIAVRTRIYQRVPSFPNP